MPLELAELSTGLPVALSFAMAGGISVLREGRRRTALNEALHELRRPLQAIALAAPNGGRAEVLESSLRVAAAAVDRLDWEINGGVAPEPFAAAPLRRLVESAVERCRARALLEGREVNFNWTAGEPRSFGDPVDLEQAVDNLISNGLDHGEGAVGLEARRVGSVIRLVVLNRRRAAAMGRMPRLHRFRQQLSGSRRHGHGLRVVRRVAATHGGSFQLRRSGDRCEARLDLPLPGGRR